MEFRERYRAAFSHVRPAGQARPQTPPGRGVRRGRRLVWLAAAAALLAGLSLTAYAARQLGLRELLLPPEAGSALTKEAEEETEVRVLSLQGYADSPEGRAMAEWLTFQAGYDADGTILSVIGNRPTGLSEEYGMYGAYTREMARMLDEIVERHGLALHTSCQVVETEEALFRQVGGVFLAAGNRAYPGYLYEDGTFHYDGEAELPGGGQVSYQFTRCMRGSLTDICYYIRDPAAYTEWTYVTADGVAVVLALGETAALLVADLGDSFVTVNVLDGDVPGWELPRTAAQLEAFADTFVLSALTGAEGTDRPAPEQEPGEESGR